MKTIKEYKEEFLKLAKKMCEDLGADTVGCITISYLNTEYETCKIEF